MGNSTSRTTNSPATRRDKTPVPSQQPAKKKSLELPDLSATTPTPASSSSRRLPPSSPIAIPNKAGPAMPTPPPPQRQQETDDFPSTHIPLNNPPRRGNPHIRGAPLQYSSTHSFATTPQPSRRDRTPRASHFVPEDVHSTIPIALIKTDEVEETASIPIRRGGSQQTQVCVVWRGPAKTVDLIRAGDNNWKGRQAMDYDEATNQWATWVYLLPGTHHIRFVVDGVVTCAEDLPTAVDDNGSLANYVAVPISGYTPPSGTPIRTHSHTLSQPQAPILQSADSFWNDSDARDAPQWTDRVPWQLESAAEEEESWLTHGQAAMSQPPQHPQAPAIPRHLEKLILNHKPPGMTRHPLPTPAPGTAVPGSSVVVPWTRSRALPITTASGTNLSAYNELAMSSSSDSRGIEPHALADDASVLPVPSHVVLNHLGTSAIRNGVLAVCDTTRYKKKYITVVYYKPT